MFRFAAIPGGEELLRRSVEWRREKRITLAEILASPVFTMLQTEQGEEQEAGAESFMNYF